MRISSAHTIAANMAVAGMTTLANVIPVSQAQIAL